MNQYSNYPRFGTQQPQQYDLDSFDKKPVRKRGLIEKVFGSGIAEKFSNPLVATGALLLCGVAVAGIIMAVYPEGETEIPVVEPGRLAYKEVPVNPGGMSIPNRDSTIFDTMEGERSREPAPVENLFAEEESVDKLAALARQVEEVSEEGKDAAQENREEPVQESMTLAKAQDTASVTLQKVEKEVDARMEAKPSKPADIASVPSSALASAPEAERPKIIHKPGENPETLEFVKSVLDKKDDRVATARSTRSISDVATGAAFIQPAAGNAAREVTGNFTITPGKHYVQLGSIKSLDGAEGEWGRLQKTFSAELGGVSYRVQAADLGARGTFYRIQAGPMSKESASKICDSIKAQKSGGCLVTQ